MKIERILIGVDDSPFADHATAYGFDIAKNLGAEVGLVHVISPVTIAPAVDDNITGLPIDTVPVTNSELINLENERTDSIIDRTIAKYAGDMQVSHFTEYGDTADSIVACAIDFKADLIVIGTHSRTGFDRLLMGSVAEHVVRHASVPVLVVPHKEEKS